MALSYNSSVVTNVIAQALDAAPRGAKIKLAQDVGVAPPTVTKWYKGQVCPTPDRWSDIERSLGLEPGTIEGAATAQPGPELVELVRALFAETDGLLGLLGAIEDDPLAKDHVKPIRDRLKALKDRAYPIIGA